MPKPRKTTNKTRLRKSYEAALGISLRGKRRSASVYPVPLPEAVLARIHRLRVPAEELTWRCNPKVFGFRSTCEVTPLKGFLGQRQALKTIKMGISMRGSGYNLFLCGLAGTESAAELIEQIRKFRLPWEPPPDRVYVQNFEDPLRPALLTLPRGQGWKFQARVDALLFDLLKGLDNLPDRRRRSVAKEIISRHVSSICDEFPGRRIALYLRDWRRHLLHNIHEAVVEDYAVNVLQRPLGREMPVIFEESPTAANLFGWIGRRVLGDSGPVHHFSEIHAGSLYHADGGVLVINAADFQGNLGVWNGLRSTLKYGRVSVDDPDGSSSVRSGGLHPQPIPISTKVLLLGDYALYDHLFELEPDFRDVFKIRVDFDSEIALTKKVQKRDYPAFISKTCNDRGLRPVSPAGVARMLEFGVRKAGRRNKVTAQTWTLADVLSEADYWCRTENKRAIGAQHIDRALREAVLRLNLVETKIAEMIHDGTILISTVGSRVGQVNGLAIYDMGDYLFAKPSRITAETSVGQSGIINIERESGFSGGIHDKGIHILVGYLRSRFAQDRPLSLTASVCFEQSYSGIDGDSASVTEVYALLSSLSGLPIRQDIAVTGSLNQKGDIQPVGGVNEKIEGFFDCVKAGRSTGTEGVIVPEQNVKELVLREDVVAAVNKKKFHIFAIDNVDQGIEILTGVSVGRRRKNGSYTPGSVFGRVDQRLEEIAQGLRRYQDQSE